MTLVTCALILSAMTYAFIALRQIVGWAAPDARWATWILAQDARLAAAINGQSHNTAA